MPQIDIKNLHVEYKNNKSSTPIVAIKDLTTSFKDDSFSVLIGYSGCGKTTLLKSIAGLIDDFKGTITFDGVDGEYLTIPERNLAYVSQEYALYPHMTVFDIIAYPLKTKRAGREEIVSSVNDVAKKLDIEFLLTRKPKVLSGGQRQRVALARALVKKPRLYLFDEPLSNLDAQERAEERRYIKKAVESTGASAIYVTHDIQEAMALSDYLYVMKDGEIVISGGSEEIYKSDNEVVKKLREASYKNAL